MDRYYDLVMANALRDRYGFDSPGVARAGAAEKERWKVAKAAFYGSDIGLISEWGGLIDFDAEEMKTLVNGEKLTYDEYLEIQKKSGHHVRSDFLKAYYDTCVCYFKGQVEKINITNKKICFKRVFVDGMYSGGGDDGFFGKEDHVWMDIDGFEGCVVGDCYAFSAEIYRYLKTGNGKMIDFGLRNPEMIRKIGGYDLPSDEQLKMQAIDEIICNELCFVKEQCNRYDCIANEGWRKQMRCMLGGKE